MCSRAVLETAANWPTQSPLRSLSAKSECIYGCVYLRCTLLRRIWMFTRFCPLEESISYAVSASLLVRSPPPLPIQLILHHLFSVFLTKYCFLTIELLSSEFKPVLACRFGAIDCEADQGHAQQHCKCAYRQALRIVIGHHKADAEPDKQARQTAHTRCLHAGMDTAVVLLTMDYLSGIALNL